MYFCISLLYLFFNFIINLFLYDIKYLSKSLNSFSQRSLYVIKLPFLSSFPYLEYNLYNGDVPLIGGETPTDTVDGENIEESMYYQVSKFVKEHELEAAVEIIETEQGVAIQVRESILFETSKSTLREDSKEVLSSIAELLSSIDNTIVVEGHTDNRPISTAEFPSNWELSVDRAVNVVKYFVENTGIDPKRLSATGYGEHHPVVPNDTEENMAKNRRVNILIIADDKE